MNLREYAQAHKQNISINEAAPEEKKSSINIHLQNGAPTGWNVDIEKLHAGGYVYALLAQLSLLQGYYSGDNTDNYWQKVIEQARELTEALDGTEAAGYAVKITAATLELLQQGQRIT